jgi:hypothetical protein
MTFAELEAALDAAYTGGYPTELRMHPDDVDAYVDLGCAPRVGVSRFRDTDAVIAAMNLPPDTGADGPTRCSYNGVPVVRDSTIPAGAWRFVTASDPKAPPA